MPDDRLARVLARLEAVDAAWLAAQLEARPPSRLHLRDEAIRGAVATMREAGASLSAAAEALARELDRYAAAGWRRERHLAELPGALAARAAWHRILRLNEGSPIGHRQIINVANGHRGR